MAVFRRWVKTDGGEIEKNIGPRGVKAFVIMNGPRNHPVLLAPSGEAGRRLHHRSGPPTLYAQKPFPRKNGILCMSEIRAVDPSTLRSHCGKG